MYTITSQEGYDNMFQVVRRILSKPDADITLAEEEILISAKWEMEKWEKSHPELCLVGLDKTKERCILEEIKLGDYHMDDTTKQKLKQLFSLRNSEVKSPETMRRLERFELWARGELRRWRSAAAKAFDSECFNVGYNFERLAQEISQSLEKGEIVEISSRKVEV